jgi:hypothetical protein
VGKHATSNIDDGYIGSGNLLLRAVRKYGRDAFKIEHLAFCGSMEELNVLEQQIVTKELVEDPMCFNLKLGGAGGWDHCQRKGTKLSEETRRKMSESHKGKPRPKRGPMSDEEKQRRSLALLGRKKPEGMGDKLREHWRRLREEEPDKLEQISKERSESQIKRFETEDSRKELSERIRSAHARRSEEIPGYREAWAERSRAAAQISAAKTRKNKA